MKLAYRGTPYTYEPPTFEMMESGLTGKYRGQATRISYVYPRHLAALQPSANLKYRGVPYSTPAGEVAMPGAARKVAVAQSSFAAIRAQLSQQVAETHRSNLYRNIEHRLQVAKEKGDQALIRLLEREMQQIA